jgi:branched-chain amino acid transport system permease protein
MYAEMLQFLVSGITVGAVYALVAFGFTLIYNCSGVINFAQGEFVMIGGMVTAFLYSAGLPLAAASTVAIVVAIVAGLALYYLAVRPAKTSSVVNIIIVTIGASILIRGIAGIAFDKQFHGFPTFNDEKPIAFFGATVQSQAVWVVAGAIAIVIAMFAFLRMTTLGKAVLATAANIVGAQLVGISVGIIFALCFAASAAIGALAGILITPITLTSYDVGIALALKGFAAAVLGGIGSPIGAVVGGLAIGVFESLGAGYISSAYKEAFAFIAIIVILLVWPDGLLGSKVPKRV